MPTNLNGQPVFFLGKKRKILPPPDLGARRRGWRQLEASCLRGSRCGTRTTTTACTQMFSLHSLLLPIVLLFFIASASCRRQGGDWCCLQDVFGGAWDFCAAKFGSDVRNRDKVCVLVRVASICSSRLHSAPLPPRAGRVCVLACSSPACRVGHPCPSAL